MAHSLHFERRILELPYRGGSAAVPVHLLSATPDFAQRPVVLLSGGIDSWKMDMHVIETGLRGIVDAAIDLGGPLVASFEPENFAHLMFGMADIAGNAFGFTTQPTMDEILTAAQPFVRSDLIAQDTNCPMLVVNGADDVHVVQQDSLIFEGRRDTEVHLVPGTGHVAASKFPEVIPMMVNWLRDHLA